MVKEMDQRGGDQILRGSAGGVMRSGKTLGEVSDLADLKQ